MNNSDEVISMLTNLLYIMIPLLFILITVFIILYIRSKKQKNEDMIKVGSVNSDAKKIAKEYTKQSIYDFMEFDKVDDNMIVQKNGSRYIMVVECQGINYDLMSEAEKISVEEAFLQFLNTLRHPIQIYIQTRKVNLNSSIDNYRRQLEQVEFQLEKMKRQYAEKLQSGSYTKEQLNKEFYELTKQTNLYEYGKDIIANTEKMSLNKNVLNRKYYIVIPYYPEEVADKSYDKEEIQNIAFSELYTKAQSIIRTLAACGVMGRILRSNELVDLLYVAYNRDESELFGVDKTLKAGYDELYTTAPDILEKQMKEINKEIEKKAIELANEKITQVKTQKEAELENMRQEFARLVQERAQIILSENEKYIGKKVKEKATQLIKEDIKKAEEQELETDKKTKEKEGEGENVEKTKKRTRRKSAIKQ